MTTVNMPEATTRLSRLVKAIKSGAKSEIEITQNRVPAARLVPLAAGIMRWVLARSEN